MYNNNVKLGGADIVNLFIKNMLLILNLLNFFFVVITYDSMFLT